MYIWKFPRHSCTYIYRFCHMVDRKNVSIRDRLTRFFRPANAYAPYLLQVTVPHTYIVGIFFFFFFSPNLSFSSPDNVTPEE